MLCVSGVHETVVVVVVASSSRIPFPFSLPPPPLFCVSPASSSSSKVFPSHPSLLPRLNRQSNEACFPPPPPLPPRRCSFVRVRPVIKIGCEEEEEVGLAGFGFETILGLFLSLSLAPAKIVLSAHSFPGLALGKK